MTKEQLNVRLAPKLKEQAHVYAITRGKSLQQVITEAVQEYLERYSVKPTPDK